MPNKIALLDRIRADIIQSNVCPDLAKQATNLVMGDGNPNAEIVFIGEAPGKKEDESGLPFMGASGKLLNEMLATIGLLRSDIYITNIVKYRPPNNRDPLQSEKQAFLPYLLAQLEVIQPTLLITLGRHSMNSILPGQQIGNIHGQKQYAQLQKNSNPVAILPLYHPAAALYNGKMRQVLFDDFASIPTILKKIT